MITSDSHLHTYFSPDSKATPDSIVEAAISAGLKTICFTDHMDAEYPHPDLGDFTFDLLHYTKELERLKETYRDKIEILVGIELGLRNEEAIKEKVRNFYQKLTASYPFDYCIGSTHVLDYLDPYSPKFWENKLLKDGLTEYFKSILHNVTYYPNFQCCGHLDYIIRYYPNGEKNYTPADYFDLIDTMLKAIITSGKGIECNTAGLKYGLGFTHPRPELLKRYHELGGEILTIASDAHAPNHVAYDFNKAEKLLISLGFRYYTVFRQKKPTFYQLDD